MGTSHMIGSRYKHGGGAVVARRLWVGGCLLVVAGCTNPLGPMDADYGKPTAADRLRKIDRLDRDRYAVRTAGSAGSAAEQAPAKVGEKHVRFLVPLYVDLGVSKNWLWPVSPDSRDWTF